LEATFHVGSLVPVVDAVAIRTTFPNGLIVEKRITADALEVILDPVDQAGFHHPFPDENVALSDLGAYLLDGFGVRQECGMVFNDVDVSREQCSLQDYGFRKSSMFWKAIFSAFPLTNPLDISTNRFRTSW